MPEHERPYSEEVKSSIQDKIHRAIDDETPDAYIERTNGKLEGGWIPYDLSLDDDDASPDKGEMIVHLAKAHENPEDGYLLKSMYQVDFDRVQAEVASIEAVSASLPTKEKADRSRALRMTAAYRTMQQRFRSQ